MAENLLAYLRDAVARGEMAPLAALNVEDLAKATAVVTARKHSHYHKDVAHLKSIDVYRVLQLFNVTDPCVQHAVKKLLVAGGRGAGKDIERDLREAVDSINRALQMIAEDAEAQRIAQTVGRDGGQP